MVSFYQSRFLSPIAGLSSFLSFRRVHSRVHRRDKCTPYPKVRLSPMQISFMPLHLNLDSMVYKQKTLKTFVFKVFLLVEISGIEPLTS